MAVPPLEAPPRPAAAPALTPLVILEDNRLLREGLTALLSRERGMLVQACTADVSHAMHVITAHHPAVVLLDHGLAEDDSIAVCTRIRALAPGCHVLVMGLGATQEEVTAFIKAGAAGFLMKDASVDELLTTIRLIANGEQTLPRALTSSLFAQILREKVVTSPDALAEGMGLTTREREVMSQLGQGLSNKEIAQRMHISVHTVKSHVHNILEKLSLHTRLEIATLSQREERPDAP